MGVYCISARYLDKVRKDFSKILGEIGLQIIAQSNLKIVKHLDVTLNFSTAKKLTCEDVSQTMLSHSL